MKTFGEFFGVYIEASKLPSSVCGGSISSLQIDTKNRMITADVAFPSLVERRVLYDVEKKIAGCKELKLAAAHINPTFPAQSFTVDYYPSLVLELKRREASVNGTLTDSKVGLNDGKLIITLTHGGGDQLI